MLDFLTFKTFISPIALIVFYYMGAIIMPLFIWFFSRWIMKKIVVIEQSYQKAKSLAWSSLSLKYKIVFVILFIVSFMFMQLLWRMAFEFLIAYIQIREVMVNGVV
ncbi:MAG TPA: DUF4282 domain-containing protein [Campylobacterales bacterium]|nr:DUF4282 domain-containing protein [Campylobacterales bacterium]HHH51587.1 DUF4282 domain-containing protein [Campylobacterales bacterium]